MLRLHTDFNNPHGLASSDEEIEVGTRVLLYDGEGNECEGYIKECHEAVHYKGKYICYVDCDWSTWKSN